MDIREQFSEKEIKHMKRIVKRSPSRRRINCILVFLLLTFALFFVCSIMYLNQANKIVEDIGLRVNAFRYLRMIKPDSLYPGSIIRVYHGVSMFILSIGIMVQIALVFMFFLLLRKNTHSIKCVRTVLDFIEKEKSGINGSHNEAQ